VFARSSLSILAYHLNTIRCGGRRREAPSSYVCENLRLFLALGFVAYRFFEQKEHLGTERSLLGLSQLAQTVIEFIRHATYMQRLH
jgi:hypothetical protein